MSATATPIIQSSLGKVRVECKEYAGDSVTLRPLPSKGDVVMKMESPGCHDLYVVMTLDTAEEFFKSALQMIDQQRRGA